MAKNCHHARVVHKGDIDLFTNYFVIEDLIKKSPAMFDDVMTCDRMPFPRVVHDKSSKFNIDKEIYPFDYFPPYCNGYSYLFPGKWAQKLYQASMREDFIFLEDVFMTGAVASRIGLRHNHIPELFTCDFYQYENRACTWRELFTAHSISDPEVLLKLDKLIRSPYDVCRSIGKYL